MTQNVKVFHLVIFARNANSGQYDQRLPSRHTTLKQRRFNVDSMSRRWINVESTCFNVVCLQGSLCLSMNSTITTDLVREQRWPWSDWVNVQTDLSFCCARMKLLCSTSYHISRNVRKHTFSRALNEHSNHLCIRAVWSILAVRMETLASLAIIKSAAKILIRQRWYEFVGCICQRNVFSRHGSFYQGKLEKVKSEVQLLIET